MKELTFKKKKYPILEIKVFHKEYFKQGQWVRIAKESLNDALYKSGLKDEDSGEVSGEAVEIDENIYHYVGKDIDFDKVKVGDMIMLDEEMKVLEVIEDGI